MRAEDIRDGDIVEIDYVEEFTKEHINEGKALVLWRDFHHQPLLMRLDREKYSPMWSCYEHIARVVGHIPIWEVLKNKAETFDKALEQEPCEDAISREELLKAIDTWDRFGVDDTNSLFRLDNLSLPHYVPYIHYDDVIKCIKGMPSVNPQEPKTGYWKVLSDGYGDNAYICECSECKDTVWVYKDADRKWNYCPNCGCRMIDPQERSE